MKPLRTIQSQRRYVVVRLPIAESICILLQTMNPVSYRTFPAVFLLFISLFFLPAVPAAAQSSSTNSSQTPDEKQKTPAQDEKLSSETNPLQQKAADSPTTQSTPSSAGQIPADAQPAFFKDLLHDQKTLWLSPLRLTKTETKWLGALTATTTILLLTDKPAPLHHKRSEDILETSNSVSKLGSGYSTFGFAGGLFLMGKLTHNDRATQTGLLATQALVHTAVLTTTLKLAFRRERPSTDSGKGEFWSGGSSFPSGHSGAAWALATVVAEEYNDKPWVKIGAYGFATAVSISRFTGRNHFASDVVVGSAIGYLIGRFIVKKHRAAEGKKKGATVAHYVNPSSRAVGVQGSLNF